MSTASHTATADAQLGAEIGSLSLRGSHTPLKSTGEPAEDASKKC